MSTSISFTDGIGAATLVNSKVAPGDRFANWTPVTRPFGESGPRQSDGAISMFVFRTDYGASFELPMIPSIENAGVAMVDLADRLVAWLVQGGTCSVQTGDNDSNVYANCGLMPGSKPELKLTDKVLLEYTLSLSLINLSGARMVCRYY